MDDKQYDRLITFILDMKKEQEEIKGILIKNTVVLDEHIRRTEASEARLEVIEVAMEPLNDHVKAMGLIGKICVGTFAALGTAAGVFEVIRNFLSM
jgi:hypothetical protein